MSQTRIWSWLDTASPMWVMLATSVIVGRGVLAATWLGTDEATTLAWGAMQ